MQDILTSFNNQEREDWR